MLSDTRYSLDAFQGARRGYRLGRLGALFGYPLSFSRTRNQLQLSRRTLNILSFDDMSAESPTPPMAEAAAPSWSAVKEAGVAADKGARRRMEVRLTRSILGIP